jgi:hypothetical protein
MMIPGIHEVALELVVIASPRRRRGGRSNLALNPVPQNQIAASLRSSQ